MFYSSIFYQLVLNATPSLLFSFFLTINPSFASLSLSFFSLSPSLFLSSLSLSLSLSFFSLSLPLPPPLSLSLSASPRCSIPARLSSDNISHQPISACYSTQQTQRQFHRVRSRVPNSGQSSQFLVAANLSKAFKGHSTSLSFRIASEYNLRCTRCGS